MSDIAAFIFAVGSHWVASMSGVVAITAGVIQYLSKKRFHPFVWMAIGIGCLFIASYQAWLDEHEARKTAEQTSSSPYHWQLLSPSEMSALRTEFRSMVPRPIAILCGGDDCGDLSRSFRDVFEDLH